jgi:hypothetical protein
MKHLRLLLLFLLCAPYAHGQINVTMNLKQRFYMLHEPVVATVNVTNLTGRDITLSDSPEFQWFGFRIIGEGEHNVSPRDMHYHVPPLEVKAGETVKRTVNLNQLYELGDPGTYRVQATVYFDGLDKFFTSKPIYMELNDGRLLWSQTAGVPEGLPGAGQMRTFSLLSHQVGEFNTLYVRIEGKDDGTIYCTTPVGRLLDNIAPQAEFDANNNFYILHLSGTRAYTLTKFGPNGEFGGQTYYTAPTTRPTMRKTPDGTLQIIGGRREMPIAQSPATTAPVPKLSDRPAGLPGAN